MTTKHSPLSELRAQAARIAELIVRAERGEVIDPAFARHLQQARSQEQVKIGIIMDDKLVTVNLPWATINRCGEVALAEFILGLMKEERSTLQ